MEGKAAEVVLETSSVGNENKGQNVTLSLCSEDSGTSVNRTIFTRRKGEEEDETCPHAVTANWGGVGSGDKIAQGGANEDGILPPEELSPASVLYTIPVSYPLPQVSSCSRPSQRYFTTSLILGDWEDSSGFFPRGGHNYFSTPMPPKLMPKKALTPVVEFECNSSEEWRRQSGVPEGETKHMQSSVHDVLQQAPSVPHESTLQSLQYRDYFADECLEIANSLKSQDPGGGIPGRKTQFVKRKREELDVSTIEAEPPPSYCTLMKSMLVCEETHINSSVDSSPTQDGPSLFGVSLLDMEKMNLQLYDFNSLEEGKRRNKGSKDQALDDTAMEGIKIHGEGLDDAESSRKRQRLGGQGEEEEERGSHEFNNTIELQTLVASSLDSRTVALHAHGHSETGQVLKRTEPDLKKDVSESSSVGGNLDRTGVSTDEIKFDNGLIERMSVTLDLERTDDMCFPVMDTVPAAITMQVIELPKDWNSATENGLNIESVQDEVTANTTKVIEALPKLSANTTLVLVSPQVNHVPERRLGMDYVQNQVCAANTTHDIASPQGQVSITNTTHVIESPQGQVSVSNTAQVAQVILSVPDEVTSLSTTHISPEAMGVIRDVHITTQDIGTFPEDVTVNTMQVIRSIPACVSIAERTLDTGSLKDQVTAVQITSNTTTQDKSLHDVVTANTTHVIESPQGQVSLTSTTQVIAVSDSHVSESPEGQYITKGLAKCSRAHGAVTGERPEETCSERCAVGDTTSRSHEGGKSCSKETLNDLAQSEPCGKMEDTHNESVFSCGSLSFSTSTPLTGSLNFKFMEPFRVPMQHNPNLPTCSAVKPPHGEQRMTTLQGSLGAQLLGGDDHTRVSRSSLLPLSTRRNFLPETNRASRLLQPKSGIPSARRSLALAAGHVAPKPVKVTLPSLLPPRGHCGNLQRQTTGTVQLIMEGASQSEVTGGNVGTERTPKKQESTATSKAVTQARGRASPHLRPPSGLSAPGSGRPSLRGRKRASTGLQVGAHGARVSALHQPVPSGGVRSSGLLRPGHSSIRPPLTLHTQRSSLSRDSSIKSEARNDSGTTRNKPPSVASCACDEPSSSQARDKPSSGPTQTKPAGALTLSLRPSSAVPLAHEPPSSSVPDTSSSNASSKLVLSVNVPGAGSGRCSHLESCPGCCVVIQKLEQELDELKKKIRSIPLYNPEQEP